jgi:hypothetical protein
MKHLFWSLGLVLIASAGVVLAAPTPTPIPGGAVQARGVTGTIGSKLFNGEVRLRPTELRDATSADGLSGTADQRWLVFTAAASNGTNRALDMQQFIASIVDGEGNTIQAQPDKVRPAGGVYGVPPGGGWKEQVFFLVPKNFKPLKIVLAPYDGKHPVFRITIRPRDYHASS